MDRKPNFQQTTSATLSLNKMTCEKNISLLMPLNKTRGFGNTADVLHLMLCSFGSNEASGADATHPNESRIKNEHRRRNRYQSSRLWIKNNTIIEMDNSFFFQVNQSSIEDPDLARMHGRMTRSGYLL